jgi:hypothetical protein
MKLFEMFDPAVQGYQDTSADNSKVHWKETRKSKLTLRQVRKLRKMLDVRNYERVTNLKKVRKQYTPVAEPAGGM